MRMVARAGATVGRVLRRVHSGRSCWGRGEGGVTWMRVSPPVRRPGSAARAVHPGRAPDSRVRDVGACAGGRLVSSAARYFTHLSGTNNAAVTLYSNHVCVASWREEPQEADPEAHVQEAPPSQQSVKPYGPPTHDHAKTSDGRPASCYRSASRILNLSFPSVRTTRPPSSIGSRSADKVVRRRWLWREPRCWGWRSAHQACPVSSRTGCTRRRRLQRA